MDHTSDNIYEASSAARGRWARLAGWMIQRLPVRRLRLLLPAPCHLVLCPATLVASAALLLLLFAMQMLALIAYIPFDGLASLYVVSAIFGLSQGGIVPSYAIIVREHFPPAEVGSRVGAVIMATLVGMALGGWLSGKVFDLTGSYQAAFINGLAWNLLNLSIASWLFWRVRQQSAARPL